MKLAGTILIAAGLAYLALNLLMYFSQRQMMYLPSRERVTPAEAGLPNVEEVGLHSATGERLLSWYGRASQGRPTVLFFHGNAGAVHHRAYRFERLMTQGFGVFMLGYPGYGGSSGTPSETSFLEAGLLAFEFLRESGVDAAEIVIYGESIGSGVAVQLAANVDAKCLVLEAPMSSAIDVAFEHYPYLFAAMFLKDSFRSADHIAAIDMPLLVMHGSADTIIPIEIGRKLFGQAREPKQFLAIAGAGHNDLHLHATEAIAMEFIDSLQRPSARQQGDQQS